MLLSPVALFVYNRLDHTRQTIKALKDNILADETNLLIFSDGPKDDVLSQKQVNEVREYLKAINGFKSVKIIERSENNGLAKSIISGTTEVINEYGRIIVLEDDMVTSRHFLQYMNTALNLYENDDKVISIHAYIYSVGKDLPETFFLRGADCWGWATWKRGWDLFESDGSKLLKELEDKKLTKDFDFSGAYPYTQMLRDQISGKNNSWAIRWYASAFLRNKLTLYPGKSLVNNIGFDNMGTHCNGINKISGDIDVKDVDINIEKIEIKEDLGARLVVISYFRRSSNIFIKVLRYLKNYLK